MVRRAHARWRRLLHRLSPKRLARDPSAVSAVEFAMILPVMLTLYIGGIQVSEALSINRKVSHVTSTLADLITQAKTITDTNMSNIFNASVSVLAPYSVTPLKVIVSEIYIDATGKAKVMWSAGRNATAYAKYTVVQLPAAIAVPNSYVVAAEAHYPFTPAIGYVLTGSFDLNSTYYLRPRLVDCISRSSVFTCP